MKIPDSPEVLLGQDDAKQVCSEALEENADEAVVIYTNDDGFVHWQATPMPLSRLIFLLEAAKFSALSESSDDTDP